MQVTPNAAVTNAAASSQSTSSGLPVKTLSQDDFLKLLIAQMTSQDPMNPQSNTDFAAQMAQFTSLEQSRSMSTTLTQMRTQQQLLQANEMLGRTVILQTDATVPISGIVQSVELVDGTPKIVVNAKPYDLSQVLAISPTPTGH